MMILLWVELVEQSNQKTEKFAERGDVILCILSILNQFL